MGENSKEMNFEAASVFVPKTISNILREVSLIDDFSKKSSRLDFYVRLLEDEMRKIDAFKRELPQCMHLIKDAIKRLKEESLKWRGEKMGPVMEEFMPLKSDSDGNGGARRSNDFSEKNNWLSSVQLWSTPIQYENQDSVLHLGSVKYQEGEGSGSGSQVQGSNFKNRGGAFVPFKKPFVGITIEEKRASPIAVDGLSLSIPVAEVESIDLNVKEDSSSGFVRPQLQQLYQPQLQKKQRRCWSPELHRRFVDALHQLGGQKSATPKLIRELMKVDGLTNDEVKSHLQKYRLHIKKLPSSSAGPSKFPWPNKNQQCGDLARAMAGNSSSPQGPFQNGGPIKMGSATAGESMEEDDDDKSESHSWKGRFQKPGEKRA